MPASFHKTRIAPTPSGFLHRGNAFSFLLTKALAEKTGAKILLRIDDLDTARTRKEYLDNIFETIAFLQIPVHEGPKSHDEYAKQYSQIHRMVFYKNALLQLIQQGSVYACTCSRIMLEKKTCNCRDLAIPFTFPGAALKIRTGEEEIPVKTFNGTLKAALPAEMKDFIVLRKDGLPSYQLASVIDDVYFGVDLIVRGEDLWNSTLAQLCLAQRLKAPSFLNATFYHHELIRNEKGEKLSKSTGADAVSSIRLDELKIEVLRTIKDL